MLIRFVPEADTTHASWTFYSISRKPALPLRLDRPIAPFPGSAARRRSSIQPYNVDRVLFGASVSAFWLEWHRLGRRRFRQRRHLLAIRWQSK
jgi:hypothetical protein